MRYAMLLAGFAVLLRGPAATTTERREAVLRNGSGAEVGKVTLREDDKKLKLHVEVHGLPAGMHGMHLHMTGKCDGPDFQTAGGHLNPGGTMQHGHKNPKGPHLGDLGNLKVGGKMKGETTVNVSGPEAAKGLKSFLALGQGGIAVVIHASADDEMTDPSGSSGARIACAVLQ